MTINECRRFEADRLQFDNRKVYARAIEDYKIERLTYTIPKGTIVQIDLHPDTPDFLFLGNDSVGIYRADLNDFFEVIE